MLLPGLRWEERAIYCQDLDDQIDSEKEKIDGFRERNGLSEDRCVAGEVVYG